MGSNNKAQKGFTLIEILVVIGIIAILAAIVIIAINPARQFAQARNSQRTANVNAILNAIGQRIADNKGVFDGAVDGGAVCPPITSATDADVYNGAVGGIDLSCLVPTYIPALPNDPTYSSGANTLYHVRGESNGRITVSAPKSTLETAVASTTISVTR